MHIPPRASRPWTHYGAASSDAGELDHGEEARAELVVACCYASELLEFVEEPLNQVALLVEPWREADRVLAVGFGWDVGPSALLRDHFTQPTSIIGFVGEHHLPFADITQQFRRRLNFVGLPGCDGKPDWQTITIGQSMDFRSKTAP